MRDISLRDTPRDTCRRVRWKPRRSSLTSRTRCVCLRVLIRREIHADLEPSRSASRSNYLAERHVTPTTRGPSRWLRLWQFSRIAQRAEYKVHANRATPPTLSAAACPRIVHVEREVADPRCASTFARTGAPSLYLSLSLSPLLPEHEWGNSIGETRLRSP